MSRRRTFWFVALLLVCGTVAYGGWAYHHQHRYKHFAIHEPGLVYRSAWLAPDALSELIETYQIRSIVNLCNPDEMTPEMWEGERAAASSGAILHAVPLPNTVELDPQAWSKHFAILADPNNYPMIVHCQHGVVRTAMFIAAYDVINRHKPAAKSLAAQPMFGHSRELVHVQAFGKSLQKYVDENRTKFAANPLEILR